jgi:hypothetical protein
MNTYVGVGCRTATLPAKQDVASKKLRRCCARNMRDASRHDITVAGEEVPMTRINHSEDPTVRAC